MAYISPASLGIPQGTHDPRLDNTNMMGECTSVGLDVWMICPLLLLLSSSLVNLMVSRVRGRV